MAGQSRDGRWLMRMPGCGAGSRDYLHRMRGVTPLLDGRSVIELGVEEGPAVGEMLRALLMARLDGSGLVQGGRGGFGSSETLSPALDASICRM